MSERLRPVAGEDPSPDSGAAPLRSMISPSISTLLGVAVAVAVIVLGVLHHAAVGAGGDSLAGADGEWLAAGALGTVAMWIAGTASFLGIMPVRPSLGRVFAVQFAASFVNHLLPAGSGAMAVNVRFMRRNGISRGAAVGAVGLNSLATAITHLALLAAAVAVTPATLGRLGGRLWTPTVPTGPVAATLVGAVLAASVLTVPRRTRRWLGRLLVRLRSTLATMAGEMRELGAVLRHPGRAAALWLGSLALPVFHTLILFSVLHGLRAHVPLGTVLVIYLGASALTVPIPSPGAIGGLDAALAVALVAAGTSSAAAIGAVLGYRMLTVWLPLTPAACMFAVLLRRRII